jgi:hypothetical protein
MGGIVVCRYDEEESRAICVDKRGIEQLDKNQKNQRRVEQTTALVMSNPSLM